MPRGVRIFHFLDNRRHLGNLPVLGFALVLMLLFFPLQMVTGEEGMAAKNSANGLIRNEILAVLPSAVALPQAQLVLWMPIEERLRQVLLEHNCMVLAAPNVREMLFQENLILTLKLTSGEWEVASQALDCDILLRCTLQTLSIKGKNLQELSALEGKIQGEVALYRRNAFNKLMILPFDTELRANDRSVFPHGLETVPYSQRYRAFYEKLFEVAFSRQIWPVIREMKTR